MAEQDNRGRMYFDSSNLNITLPNRCSRCHHYRKDGEAPNLWESLVIVLYKAVRASPCNVFKLLAKAYLVYISLTCLGLIVNLLADQESQFPEMCFLMSYILSICCCYYFVYNQAKDIRDNITKLQNTPLYTCLEMNDEN